MTCPLESTVTILERLVGFDSVSGRPTHEIVGYIKDYLADHGVDCTLSFDDTGERANLFATIGPEIDGGVVLNGHTDVVPVAGQNSRGVVSFGTDAGYFSDAGFSTVVFGPGTITRAHKPDEYIEIGEIAEGLQFLAGVTRRLSR